MVARAAMILAIVFGAAAAADAAGRDCTTLMEWVDYYSERYSILKAALESSPELEKFASSCKTAACTTDYTVLVATDRTFESFMRGMGSNVTDLFEDPQRLEDIVRNHIIVNNSGNFIEGDDVETALPSSNLSVFLGSEGTQTCFMSWSYACADGAPDALRFNDICQGRTLRVNSLLVPPVLDDGAAAPAAAVTVAGRR